MTFSDYPYIFLDVNEVQIHTDQIVIVILDTHILDLMVTMSGGLLIIIVMRVAITTSK